MITLIAVWTWVKKHWQIVLAGLGVLLGFLFGFEAKKRPVVVTGVDPVKDNAEKATQQADQVAQEKHDVAVQQDQAQAAAQDAAVVKEVSTETQKIETSTDPTDQTNEYLKSVSAQIEGPGNTSGGQGG